MSDNDDNDLICIYHTLLQSTEQKNNIEVTNCGHLF